MFDFVYYLWGESQYTMLRHIRFLFLFLAFFSISAFGNNYTDSLRVAMEKEQDDIKRAHAMALLAIEMVPQNMDSAKVLLEQSSYLASLYITNLREFEKGLEYAKKGLEIAIERGDRSTLFTLYLNIGIAHFQQEMFEEAMTWYQKSMDMEAAGTSEYNLAASLIHYKKLYAKTGQLSTQQKKERLKTACCQKPTSLRKK